MNLYEFLKLFTIQEQGHKTICVRDQYSDLYIGRLDGKSDKSEWALLNEREVVGVVLNTYAVSGNKRVEVSMEISVE